MSSIVHFWHRFEYTHRESHYSYTSPSTQLQNTPLISIIIPVFNANVHWLKKAIESIKYQLASNWELCIIDDKSTDEGTIKFLQNISDPQIRITFLPKNEGISHALNIGIKKSQGDYVTFLDQDDTLELDTMGLVNNAIQKFHPDIIYSDEDHREETSIHRFFYTPHFKPDFSPTLLDSHNYVTHLMIVKRTILESISGFQSKFDGAQDYDLILRLFEHADSICHIRKVLYHWRMHKASTSNKVDSAQRCTLSGKKVLEEKLERQNKIGSVNCIQNHNFYHVKRKIDGNPYVSIIIPFKDNPVLLENCLNSIVTHTVYSPYEILLVDNNSVLPETIKSIEKWKKKVKKIQIIPYPHPFNYSAINNYAVTFAHGEFIVLMNNDIEILSPDWIKSLLEHAQQDTVGAVGGKLYYSDGSIQHAGIAIGIGGLAGHPYKYFPGCSDGYFNRLLFLSQNVSAVTGALMMVKKSKYLEIGGLDEKNLPIALNDVDFCLRLLEKGYLNVFTPFCQAIHHESKTRGYEDTQEKKSRFFRESNFFRTRHIKFFDYGDPWYNPNFSDIDESMRFSKTLDENKLFGVFRRGKDGRMYYDPLLQN